MKNYRKATWLMLSLVIGVTVHTMAQNHNSNAAVNNNNIIINNQPVIERKEYIVKYRTVYVDRPQPKRVARKLAKPVCLLGYLWIYPEDLGTYSKNRIPTDIIRNINRQALYGRNNWRIPTPSELALMENDADALGLGEDIYLATDHCNGILRLVSDGESVAEQTRAKQQAKLESAQAAARQRELERQREEQRRQQQAEARRNRRDNQRAMIQSRQAWAYNNLLWRATNVGATTETATGRQLTADNVPAGWRLPTLREFRSVLSVSTFNGSYYRTPSGDIIPNGTYLVRDGGNIVSLNLKLSAVGNQTSGLIKAVQDME